MDAISGKILSEPLLELSGVACARATELNSWPATEPIHNDQIMISTSLKIVRGHLLEWIVWVLEWLWGSTGLRWGTLITDSALVPGLLDLRGDAGPPDTGLGSEVHASHSLVGTV